MLKIARSNSRGRRMSWIYIIRTSQDGRLWRTCTLQIHYYGTIGAFSSYSNGSYSKRKILSQYDCPDRPLIGNPNKYYFSDGQPRTTPRLRVPPSRPKAGQRAPLGPNSRQLPPASPDWFWTLCLLPEQITRVGGCCFCAYRRGRKGQILRELGLCQSQSHEDGQYEKKSVFLT